jgi:hypothetical protein
LTVEIDAVLVCERGSRPAIASNEDAAVGLERAELDPGDADFARSTAPAPALPDEEAGPAQSGAAPAAPKP